MGRTDPLLRFRQEALAAPAPGTRAAGAWLRMLFRSGCAVIVLGAVWDVVAHLRAGVTPAGTYTWAEKVGHLVVLLGMLVVVCAVVVEAIARRASHRGQQVDKTMGTSTELNGRA